MRPAGEEPPKKPKKLKGQERVRAMLKASAWSWKGSSLDPAFRRPKISLKRKRERSSSSDSSNAEQSSAQTSEQEDLFPEEGQARHIARKCPGLLTRHALREARKRLALEVGEDAHGLTPRAAFVKYYRQIFMQSGASTPMKREYLTLATILDSILEGDILKAADFAIQRLKSIEQISQGVPPHLANRLELIAPEIAALASIEEAKTAAQEQRREDRVKTSWKGKGDQGAKGGKDPKGKGKDGKTNKGSWKSCPQNPKGGHSQASEVIPVRD